MFTVTMPVERFVITKSWPLASVVAFGNTHVCVVVPVNCVSCGLDTVKVVVDAAVATVCEPWTRLLIVRLELPSRNAIAFAVAAAASGTAVGVAEEPVELPITLLAARFAIFDRVTAAAAIVVALDPVEAVTSPVKAGRDNWLPVLVSVESTVISPAPDNCVNAMLPDP